MDRLVSRLLTTLRGCPREQFTAEFVTGVIGGIAALPVVGLEGSGLDAELGEENVPGTIEDALNWASGDRPLAPWPPRPAFAAPPAPREKGGAASA